MKPILIFVVSLILAPFAVGIGVEIARPYLPEVLPVALGWLAMLVEWGDFLGLSVAGWAFSWAF